MAKEFQFQYKIQGYQTDAVMATVDLFTNQVKQDDTTYLRDLGKKKKAQQTALELRSADEVEMENIGHRNAELTLTDAQLLENLHRSQDKFDIPQIDRLVKEGEVPSFDIEMETGTGKTYVYIKTMFELYKKYGWCKFIVVVPSIAIREGVNESFKNLEDHFMELYKQKARFFIYDSKNLHKIDDFSSDSHVNVMIINSQAFAKINKDKQDLQGLDSGKTKMKSDLIIYSKRDDFQSRRPIDVIAANRPIIIMDEPQKLGGAATMAGIKSFRPLFILNYSATHKTQHNLVYALDALDAYKQRLVKKIQVKGFNVENLRGTQGYMYLDHFVLDKNKAPKIVLEIECQRAGGAIHRDRKTLELHDDVRAISKLAEYNGYVITDINPERGYVGFQNGKKIALGQVLGNSDEAYMQRLQIRETIKSHFLKERELFKRGIKCLSLFFIDEVANYKSYDEQGEEVKGRLWTIFEEEYQALLAEQLQISDKPYNEYLKRWDVDQIHSGYFSIDKGKAVNSKTNKEGISDDISAYDLILKNKKRLLSFEEPVRFIFSHSALREGWDNPNVFQICTLRHANSTIAQRQEVGRGLRICVDQFGVRMDKEELQDSVHDINKLTVVANQSYEEFVKGLQSEIKAELRERPSKANETLFVGKKVKDAEGVEHIISAAEASSIYSYLWDNDYIDDQGKVTDNYKFAMEMGEFEPMSKKIRPYADAIHKLVQSTFNSGIDVSDMIENGNKAEIRDNKLNANFEKEEFKNLWKALNHKYVYKVSYDSEELICNAAESIMQNLSVTKLRYTVVTGEQDKDQVAEFAQRNTKSTEEKTDISTSTVRYDLVGDIASNTKLTRKTVLAILKKAESKFPLFKNNPEEFISKVSKLILDQKATMIVEGITYDLIDGTYDSDIFTMEKHKDVSLAYEAKKHITDYVFTDGYAKDGQSTERQFAEALDAAEEVEVFAKLPRTFFIPTPVGNYAPDWAIAFKKGSVKHIFFVAETKGSMDSMQLKGVEKAKIDCAEVLFNKTSTSEVRYHKVTSYSDLLNVMQNIE